MKSEDRLLLATLRTQINAAQAAQIKRLARENVDWAALIDKADRHRALPLLYLHLNESCPDAVPAPVLSELADLYSVSHLRGRMLTAELRRLLAACDERGIRVLPFKGATLALTAYGSLARRQFGDLDLLVAEEDVERMRDLLETLNYKYIWSISWEMHLSNLNQPVGVDLHWAFTRVKLAFPLFLDELWERRIELPYEDGTIRGLSPEDHLLVRAQNAAQDYWKDDWPRLQHVCDVAELIGRDPPLDWDALLERATRLRCRGTLFFFLALAVDLLGAELPDDVAQAVAADPQIAPMVAAARQRVVPEQGAAALQPEPDFIKRHLFALRLKEFLPLPLNLSSRMLYGLSGLYYRPQAAWYLRARYWLSGLKPRAS